jgi:hypothetical protein
MKTVLTFLTLIAAVSAQTFPPPAAGNVTLPIDEYNKLLELASKPVKKPSAPPVPYVIKSADVKIDVSGDSAKVTMQLEGEVFATRATRVPLVNGLIVFDARQQGKELPLEQEAGAHLAILDGPGPFAVTLTGGMPVSVETGRAVVKLPPLAAGTARLRFEIAGEHTNINVSPGLITERKSLNGCTTVDATLVPDQPVTIWWAARETVAPAVPKEVRFLSDVKTLVSVNEAQIGLTAIADISVVQGEPAQFEMEIPAGFEVTGATGATLDSSEVRQGVLILKLNSPAAKSHQFLVSLEKPTTASPAALPLLRLKGTQRETGELLIDGEGAMELTATENGGLKRMDLKETSPVLLSLARSPAAHNELYAAFRYHRQPEETPGVSLAWVRFPDSSVPAAVADEAVVTTLVTSEGRSLTEVRLTVRNQAQPFLKVGLPAGSSIVSADVAGEKVKPVEGADGSRVPLLRPGFRATGAYEISYVFVHAGLPFAKKGGSELDLPKMDIPIGLVRWEVFLPQRYKVTDFHGDVVLASLMAGDLDRTVPLPASSFLTSGLMPAQLEGVVTDPAGGVVPNAVVTVTNRQTGASWSARTDSRGHWVVSNLMPGSLMIDVQSVGFTRWVSQLDYDGQGRRVNTRLQLGALTETITISSEAPLLKTESGEIGNVRTARADSLPVNAPPSANVSNLQRRVVGVLPIAIDVPHAGRSFQFVRPLVVNEETKVSFNYKTAK